MTRNADVPHLRPKAGEAWGHSGYITLPWGVLSTRGRAAGSQAAARLLSDLSRTSGLLFLARAPFPVMLPAAVFWLPIPVLPGLAVHWGWGCLAWRGLQRELSVSFGEQAAALQKHPLACVVSSLFLGNFSSLGHAVCPYPLSRARG